jgi:hypothetical protein
MAQLLPASRQAGRDRSGKGRAQTALQGSASVAGLPVTTEAMVAEKPKPKTAPAMPPGGGMGDMGRPSDKAAFFFLRRRCELCRQARR